jgi:hypothetical protein
VASVGSVLDYQLVGWQDTLYCGTLSSCSPWALSLELPEGAVFHSDVDAGVLICCVV